MIVKSRRAVVLRYARVLLELKDSRCFEMIKALATIDDDTIRMFINDPTISPESKAKIVANSFGAGEKSERLLKVIFEHKRFQIFRDLYDISWKLWLRSNEKEHVILRSAQQLEKREKDEIIKVIKEIRKLDPIVEVVLDEKLLAGVVIDFEDSVADLSAAGALKKAATLMYGG